MSAVAGRSDEQWAQAIAEAYAEQTKPPLTDKLKQQVRERLAAAIQGCDLFESACAEQVNAALDAFETELDAATGPRIVAIDRESGTVNVKHRSEGGQPLRAFGGQ